MPQGSTCEWHAQKHSLVIATNPLADMRNMLTWFHCSFHVPRLSALRLLNWMPIMNIAFLVMPRVWLGQTLLVSMSFIKILANLEAEYSWVIVRNQGSCGSLSKFYNLSSLQL